MDDDHLGRSNQIVLYGAPGVGKLTVARELATLTSYKVAHNHLAIDFATAVFDFGTPAFSRLRDSVRLKAAEEAARESIGLIHTFVLLTQTGVDYLNQLCSTVEPLGTQICFVQLRCSLQTLNQRVKETGRAEIGKITGQEQLQAYIDDGALTKLMPDRDSLVIDNTEMRPIEAARQIAEHYNL